LELIVCRSTSACVFSQTTVVH